MMEKLFFRATVTTMILALLSSSVFAGSHNEAIREAMKDPNLANDPQELQDLWNQLEAAKERVEQLFFRWEELESK